jgi:hypothetical protein
MAMAVRLLTDSQWVAERTADAEELLWRKTCKQCHVLQNSAGSALPTVAAGQITQRWLPRAKFDHDAHRGFPCVSCHTKALSSKESSDILIPGITNCQTCQAPARNMWNHVASNATPITTGQRPLEPYFMLRRMLYNDGTAISKRFSR